MAQIVGNVREHQTNRRAHQFEIFVNSITRCLICSWRSGDNRLQATFIAWADQHSRSTALVIVVPPNLF